MSEARGGPRPAVVEGFTWNDGERLVRFGVGALDTALDLIAERGLAGYALLATERALSSEGPSGGVEALAEGADTVLLVPDGPVSDAAAAVRGEVGARPVVALGGGRVIDSAKAIAAADGVACAAVPTTLSGAELTPIHRLPDGVQGVATVRPSLVIADPALTASQPMPALAASAMNALGHAVEALYVPGANPVADLSALRAAELIARALSEPEPDRDALALGALLAGYALGVTGLALHHVLCQTIVRVAGTPHGRTNAVMLPHSVGFVAPRAPGPVRRLAAALGGPDDPSAAAGLVAGLAARAGVARLSELGVGRDVLPEVVEQAHVRRELFATPGLVERSELLDLLTHAL